jgi:SagB-type dehydrogenase family enzyme
MTMAHTFSLSLIEAVSPVTGADGSVTLEAAPATHRPRLPLGGLSTGLTAVLETLRSGGATIAALTGRVLAGDGPAGLVSLHQFLSRLGRGALLTRTLLLDDVPLAALEPMSVYFKWEEGCIAPTTAYALSRFAYCRSEGGRLVLECPRSHARVVLHELRAGTAVHALAQPRDGAGLAAAVAGLDTAAATALLELLANAGAVVAVPPGTASPEETDPALAQWEFHDLLFHNRTRLGRHSNPFGGTFPFKDRFEALPAVKPPMSAEVIPLPRPDLERLRQDDLPFTTVLEDRVSVRSQGAEPMTTEQLGELLYRACRIKKLTPDGAASFRPSPGGGALHPLEIYPFVSRCARLEPGVYHYQPLDHALERLGGLTPYANATLDMAGIISQLPGQPQVLLVLAARFQRMQRKYQGMTYAAILKDVGCLYQTLYLVATAMGLAPCALGGGHTELFAQATGLDYYVEGSVGEFVVGTRGTP